MCVRQLNCSGRRRCCGDRGRGAGLHGHGVAGVDSDSGDGREEDGEEIEPEDDPRAPGGALRRLAVPGADPQ